jgi:hypothetical protein
VIFLNGALLAFLGALGLPLLLHLLSPRRRRARELSTLRFLKEIESTRLRRVQLRRWLLLLVRTALLAALVLAFARPVSQGAAGWLPTGEQPRRLALLLDDSASSRLPLADGAGSGFEALRARSAALLDELGPGDEVLWARLARPVQIHGPESPEAARRRLLGWEPAWSAADAGLGLQLLLEAAADWPALGRELHLFSDLRLELPEEGVSAPADWRRVLHGVPVDDRGLAEWEPLRPGGTILKAGEPFELIAGLRGGAGRELRLELELEGESVARARLEDGGDPRSQRLAFRLPRSGWLRGLLRLEGDGVPGAGELPVVLHAPAQRRLLLACDDPAQRRALRAALQPDERYGRDFLLEELPLGSLDRLRAEDTDLLVLAVRDPLPAGAAALLVQARERGLGLWLLPGGERPEDLAALATLAQALDLPVTDRLESGGPWRLGRFELEHPIFRGLLEEGGRPEPVAFRRLLAPGSGGAAARSLVFTDDGRPLLLAAEGSGRALLLLSGLAEEASGLARSGLLAPLMQRGLRWLAGADLLPAGAVVGEPAEIEAPLPGPRAWRIDGPGGGGPLRLDERTGRLLVPPLPLAGRYRIHAEGGEESWLAVRPPLRERLRPPLDAAGLEALGGAPWTAAHEAQDAAGREVSGWLLALAALLLALESWLATGGGRARETAEKETP